MKDRLNWNFNDYVSELKYWGAFLKVATLNNKFIKDRIAYLQEEIWEFFPQDCIAYEGTIDIGQYNL